MKKINFVRFLLPLFFFICLLIPVKAADFTYQPEWKKGDRFQYDTVLAVSYSENSSFPRSVEFRFRQNFEILSSTPNEAVMALSFENITYKDAFMKEPITPFTSPAEQHFIQKFVLKYRMDSTGTVTKITNMDELASLFPKNIPFNQLEDPLERYWTELFNELLGNLLVNYSNYSVLPMRSYHGPHHSLYLNKAFPVEGTPIKNPVVSHQPPIYPFTLQDIRLEIPGESQVKTTSETDGLQFEISSRYLFDKKEVQKWGQTILDRLVLTPEMRQSVQSSFNRTWKDQLVDFNGVWTDTLQLTPDQNVPIQNESLLQLSFSYKDQRIPSSTSSEDEGIQNGVFTVSLLSKLVQ